MNPPTAAPLLCVLGCRSDSLALRRRVTAAAEAYGGGPIVVSGGRAWNGVVEADAMAALLVDAAIPADAIVRERCSFDTRDNARFTAALLARHGRQDVTVVTCAWHLPRAMELFREAGLDVAGLAASEAPAGTLTRLYRRAREAVSRSKDRRRGAALA